MALAMGPRCWPLGLLGCGWLLLLTLHRTLVVLLVAVVVLLSPLTGSSCMAWCSLQLLVRRGVKPGGVLSMSLTAAGGGQGVLLRRGGALGVVLHVEVCPCGAWGRGN